VIRNWPGIQQCFLFERRLGVEYLHFAHVLQRAEVSISVTEFEATETTARVFASGE
jgi:hypothetical protein